MSKPAIIYFAPACPRCSTAKNRLEALGYAVEERDAVGLASGQYHDAEAMAELAINGGALPVVVIAGRAVRESDDLYKLIMENFEW